MDWFETVGSYQPRNLCSSGSSSREDDGASDASTECPDLDLQSDVRALLDGLRCNKASVAQETLTTLRNLCIQDANARGHLGKNGVTFLFRLVKGAKKAEVRLEALTTLNVILDKHVAYQSVLCTTEVFQWAHCVLQGFCNTRASSAITPSPQTLLTPSPLLRNLVYLLISLLANNSLAQRLLREHNCLQDLIDLYRQSFPRFLTDVMTSLRPHPFVVLWQTVNAALCYAVNNPRNEENQSQCVSLFPFLVSQLEETSECALPLLCQQALCRLLALTLSCNISAQDAFSFAGGLHVLANHCLLRWQGEALLAALDLLDTAVTDHANNASLTGSLGIPSTLLIFVEDTNSDLELQTKATLTLGHCADICELNRQLLQDREGFVEVLRDLISSDNADLAAAAKYLLCLAVQGAIQDDPNGCNFNVLTETPVSQGKETDHDGRSSLMKKKTTSDYWSKESGKSSSLERVFQRSVQLDSNSKLSLGGHIQTKSFSNIGKIRSGDGNFEPPQAFRRDAVFRGQENKGRTSSNASKTNKENFFMTSGESLPFYDYRFVGSNVEVDGRSPKTFHNLKNSDNNFFQENNKKSFMASDDLLDTRGIRYVGSNVEVDSCGQTRTATQTKRNSENHCFDINDEGCSSQSIRGNNNDRPSVDANSLNSQERMIKFYLELKKRRHETDTLPNKDRAIAAEQSFSSNQKFINTCIEDLHKQKQNVRQFETIDLEGRNNIVGASAQQTEAYLPNRKDFPSKINQSEYMNKTLKRSKQQACKQMAFEKNRQRVVNPKHKTLSQCEFKFDLNSPKPHSVIYRSNERLFHSSDSLKHGFRKPFLDAMPQCSKDIPMRSFQRHNYAKPSLSRRSKCTLKDCIAELTSEDTNQSLFLMKSKGFTRAEETASIPFKRRKRFRSRQNSVRNKKISETCSCCSPSCYPCCTVPVCTVSCRMAQSEAESRTRRRKLPSDVLSLHSLQNEQRRGPSSVLQSPTKNWEQSQMEQLESLSTESILCSGCSCPLLGGFPLLHSRNFQRFLQEHAQNLCSTHKVILKL